MSGWGWPQWAAVAWFALVLVSAAAMHGRPRTGLHDFPTLAFFAAAQAWVLWMGGFFE